MLSDPRTCEKKMIVKLSVVNEHEGGTCIFEQKQHEKSHRTEKNEAEKFV